MKKTMLTNIINSPKNLLVSGNLASGKTKDVLFPYVENLIAKKESIFIIDSKEEYLQYFSNRIKEDYKLIIVNLRDFKTSESFNPLEYPFKVYQNGNIDYALNLLENVCSTIFYNDGKLDSYWTDSATSYVMAIILKLFAKNESVNLKDISTEVDKIENLNLEDKKKYFQMHNENNIAYRYASPIINAPKETNGGIISIVRQRLNVLTHQDSLNKLLETTTFSFNKINHHPTVIFFITCDENTKNNCLANMLINQLFMYLIKNSKRKFNFILDNFDDLPIINNFQEMLSSGPSRYIKFAISTRDKDLLYLKYSKYLDKICNTINLDNNQNDILDNNLEENSKDFEITIDDYNFDLDIKEMINIVNKLEEDENINLALESIDSELEQFKIDE